MPSAFSWPMLVPSSLRLPAPVNQGVRQLKVNRLTLSPLHVSLLGVLLSSAMVFNEELANHRYALAHQGQGLCGLSAMAAVFVAFSLSFLLSLCAGIWAYKRYKRERSAAWKWKVAAVVSGPIWFVASVFLITSGFEVAKQWGY